MDSTMASPWNHDNYSGDNRGSSLLDPFERSTSAPPISTEARLNLGSLTQTDNSSNNNHHTSNNAKNRSSFLFGDVVGGGGAESLFSNSGRGSAPLSSDHTPTNGSSLYLAFDDHLGRSDVVPSSTFSETLRSSLPGISALGARSASVGAHEQFDDLQTSGPPSIPKHLDRLMRSKSAAPSMHRVGPPPGLEDQRNSSFLDSGLVDGLVQRRPASTSLLGEQPSPSPFASHDIPFNQGAVRPAARNVEDILREDNPSRSTPYDTSDDHDYLEYSNQRRNASRHDSYEYGRARERDPYDHRQSQQQQQHSQDDIVGVANQFDSLQVRPGQSYNKQMLLQRDLRNSRGHQYPERQSHTQVLHQDRGLVHNQQQKQQHILSQQQEHVVQQPLPVYAHTSTNNNHNSSGGGNSNSNTYDRHERIQQPQARHVYGQNAGGPPPQATQPVYLSQPTSIRGLDGGQSGLAAPQAFTAGGQTVIVNSPYGYPVQYTQPIVHRQIAGGGPEYIQVVPVGGQLAYWPQADMPATLQVVHTGLQVPQMGAPSLESSGRGGRSRGMDNNGNNNSSRSPNQRSGRSRRSGAQSRRDSQQSAADNSAIDEFRNSKNRDRTIFDIQGKIVDYCKDQNCSRFIQQRLECGNEAEQQIVASEVLPEIRQLRDNVFGNYVVQKLLEFGTPKIRADIRDTMRGEMLELSLQEYGCRVVQKALEKLDENDLPVLLLEFHHNVLKCIHNQHGNHVIQKWIEVMSSTAREAARLGEVSRAEYLESQIDFIIADVLSNVRELSCHTFGCRVLQRILEHCVEVKKTQLLDKISAFHRELLDDQFGNYVIQHVLEFGRHGDRESVMIIVIQQGILRMSQQKYASNVVEKLLQYGTPAQRNQLIREMMRKVVDGTAGRSSSVVLLMVRDQYANYVVQTALNVVEEGAEKRMLLEELNAHLSQLRNYTYAKNIVAKLSS